MFKFGSSRVTREPRYAFAVARRASVQAGFQCIDFDDDDGIPFMETVVRDISASGVSLATMGAERAIKAAQSVLIHIEGIGPAVGSVSRAFDGGFAVAFADPAAANSVLARELGTLQPVN